MWHIPNDLLPGPALQESRDESLSLLGRMVRSRRHLRRTLGALSPEDSMKTVKQFLEPIAIRWIMRNKCYYCAAPATRKCRTHGTRLCESSHCKMTHRRLKASVSGNLTRPFCEYAQLNTWLDHCIHAAAVFVTAVGFVWFFALMGVI